MPYMPSIKFTCQCKICDYFRNFGAFLTKLFSYGYEVMGANSALGTFSAITNPSGRNVCFLNLLRRLIRSISTRLINFTLPSTQDLSYFRNQKHISLIQWRMRNACFMILNSDKLNEKQPVFMPVNSSFSCCTISSVFDETKDKTCSRRWYHPFSETFPGNQIQQT